MHFQIHIQMHQLNIMIHFHFHIQIDIQMHQIIISFDAMHELLSDAMAWHDMMYYLIHLL